MGRCHNTSTVVVYDYDERVFGNGGSVRDGVVTSGERPSSI